MPLQNKDTQIPFAKNKTPKKELNLLSNTDIEGWDAGGCYMYARALQKVLGGSLRGICSVDEDAGDYPVEHVVLLKDGMYYDVNGKFTKEQLLEKWTKLVSMLRKVEEPLVIKGLKDKGVWLGEHWWDDEIFKALVEVLRKRYIKKTSAYNDDLAYVEPEVPMTDEDLSNIQQTDAISAEDAMDMTKIPHPEMFKEVESKGVFFIGGDNVNVDTSGDESPFGIDYPNHFNGWAVGANVGQKLKKKADEGYFYVAVISYPTNSSMHVNPAFKNAMERKLKQVAEYVGVSYEQVRTEAEDFFLEQAKQDRIEEAKNKRDKFGQGALFSDEDTIPNNIEIKKDLTFYKKIIDLLKKREVEDIKERGGNVKTDAKVKIKDILLEVETEISHKNSDDYKGNIVGVARFAEVITGKDRVVKHEVYPEEIIFNNWKQLPEPIPVAELFSALESKVKPEDIQKTFWVMLQTYNLTVTKDHPIAQFLMDFAEEGMTKTSGSKNYMKVYRVGSSSEDGRFYVSPEWDVSGWKNYLHEDKVTPIVASKLYIPNSDISFSSWAELQSMADNGLISEKELSKIVPEESGINNLQQFEVAVEDIISSGIEKKSKLENENEEIPIEFRNFCKEVGIYTDTEIQEYWDDEDIREGLLFRMQSAQEVQKFKEHLETNPVFNISADDIIKFYELEYKLSRLKLYNDQHPNIYKWENYLTTLCDRLLAYFKMWIHYGISTDFIFDNGDEGYYLKVASEQYTNLNQKILAINALIQWGHSGGSFFADDTGYGYTITGLTEYMLDDLSNGKFVPKWDKELEHMGIPKQAMTKFARRARQDDSLPVLNKLISMGYDKAQWHIHELLHKDVDICDTYNGKIFDLRKMVSGLKYNAPIFEHSHVNCYCYLICYSTTNPDLESVVVDWTGIEEGGRVIDRKDAGERKADFERLFNSYRESLDDIENNPYVHGEFGEPLAGIYSFDLTMYDDTYFNVNELQEIRDKVLELVLDRADRYGITIEDAEISGNHIIVQTSAMLRNYDFSKEDWVEVEWTYNKRREELTNVIMDLSKLTDWLKVTQDSINNLLLQIEQQNANQQMDKFSGLRKIGIAKYWESPEGKTYNVSGGHSRLIDSGLPQEVLTEVQSHVNYPEDWQGAINYLIKSGWIRYIKDGRHKMFSIYSMAQARQLDDLLIKLDVRPEDYYYLDVDSERQSIKFSGKDYAEYDFNVEKLWNRNEKLRSFQRVASGLEKRSKLNLNTIRQFFIQERDRGVVEDKILNELHVDLIILFTQIANVLNAYDSEMRWDYEKLEEDPYLIDWYSSHPEFNNYDDVALNVMYHEYHPEDAERIVELLTKAKTDKQKILAINEALNESHFGGFILGHEYDELRKSLGRLKAIQAHHMRFILSGRVDFLREKFIPMFTKEYMNNWLESVKDEENAGLEEKLKDKAFAYDFHQAEANAKTDAGYYFNDLLETDPTKNKQYLQWLINQMDWRYVAGYPTKWERYKEDFAKVKSYLEAHYKANLQKKLKPEIRLQIVTDKDGKPMVDEQGHRVTRPVTFNPADINHLKDWRELQEVVKPYLYGSGVTLSDTEKEIVKEEANLIYDGQNWQIWVPKTEKSACILGKGTEWCTTYGYEGGRYPNQTENQFKYYNRKDDLIIIINKAKPEEKYQFHFESGQFMDADDSSIDLKEFLNEQGNEEVKEALHDYLINRDRDTDVGRGAEVKVNNLLKADAPFEKIEQLLKILPQDKRKGILSSARFIDRAVKSGLLTEEDANSVTKKTDLYFKDGKCYWVVGDWNNDDLLDLFDDSGRDVNLRSGLKTTFSGDAEPVYYDQNVDLNDYSLDLIDKDNFKRIKLYLKGEGYKLPRTFNYKDLDKLIYEEDIDELKNALETALTRAQESADSDEYYKKAVKAIESYFGERKWLDDVGLGFEIDPSDYSRAFTDEDGAVHDSMSGILSSFYREDPLEDRDLWNAFYHGAFGDIDDDPSYFNERLSEELNDLGVPEIPVKPIKKVKKAISKILREGIFRKKSMLEKLSRLEGFTVLGEKIYNLKSGQVPPQMLDRIKQFLERVNKVRDFEPSLHFSKRLKERTKDSGKGVYAFIKSHDFSLQDISEFSMSDDMRRLEKVLFEIKTPANVTGVEDVVYLAVDSNLNLITFFNRSATGQRVTMPQRYVNAPDRV